MMCSTLILLLFSGAQLPKGESAFDSTGGGAWTAASSGDGAGLCCSAKPACASTRSITIAEHICSTLHSLARDFELEEVHMLAYSVSVLRAVPGSKHSMAAKPCDPTNKKGGTQWYCSCTSHSCFWFLTPPRRFAAMRLGRKKTSCGETISVGDRVARLSELYEDKKGSWMKVQSTTTKQSYDRQLHPSPRCLI